MKWPANDVSLSDSKLFLVKWTLYADHLAHAPERQLVSAWNIFTYLSWQMSRNPDAVNTGLRIMATSIGIIWIALDRVHVHVPDMVLLFHTVLSIFRRVSSSCLRQFREDCHWLSNRQVNIDYSIRWDPKWFLQNFQALIIYDICCQWIIHFQEHVSESEFWIFMIAWK